jgi:hypothetical protein
MQIIFCVRFFFLITVTGTWEKPCKCVGEEISFGSQFQGFPWPFAFLALGPKMRWKIMTDRKQRQIYREEGARDGFLLQRHTSKWSPLDPNSYFPPPPPNTIKLWIQQGRIHWLGEPSGSNHLPKAHQLTTKSPVYEPVAGILNSN